MRSKQEQPTKKHIDRLITNAFNTLQAPIKPNNQNKIDAFLVLDFSWLGAPLNFSILEPNGTLLTNSKSKQNGQAGFLQAIKTKSGGSVHYFASCDDKKLQTGDYVVQISENRSVKREKAQIVLKPYFGYAQYFNLANYNQKYKEPRNWTFRVKVLKDESDKYSHQVDFNLVNVRNKP